MERKNTRPAHEKPSESLPDCDGQCTDTFDRGRWEESRWRRRQAPEDLRGGWRSGRKRDLKREWTQVHAGKRDWNLNGCRTTDEFSTVRKNRSNVLRHPSGCIAHARWTFNFRNAGGWKDLLASQPNCLKEIKLKFCSVNRQCQTEKPFPRIMSSSANKNTTES